MAKGFRSHRSVPCADLHFRPRERGCGLCGNPFTTTPLGATSVRGVTNRTHGGNPRPCAQTGVEEPMSFYKTCIGHNETRQD